MIRRLLSLNFLIVGLFMLIGIISVPFSCMAVDDFSITPVVIDEKAKARDILKETIVIKNNSERRLNLYPSVNNIDSLEGEEEFKVASGSQDRMDSLANWIEISRGVIDLAPGEEKIIPFVIRVNLNAKAGVYHAQISFGTGSTRADADKVENKTAIMVNVEVLDDVKERLQLGKFITDNIFFSGDDVLFSYNIENIGNKELAPQGDIRIYNRKGEEVATINANKDKKSFAPDKTIQLASVWNAGNGFGRYKALLNMNYGSNQASIQDTVFFWIIPWKIIAGVFVGCLISVILFASFFHKWLGRKNSIGELAVVGAPPEKPRYPNPFLSNQSVQPTVNYDQSVSSTFNHGHSVIKLKALPIKKDPQIGKHHVVDLRKK